MKSNIKSLFLIFSVFILYEFGNTLLLEKMFFYCSKFSNICNPDSSSYLLFESIISGIIIFSLIFFLNKRLRLPKDNLHFSLSQLSEGVIYGVLVIFSITVVLIILTSVLIESSLKIIPIEIVCMILVFLLTAILEELTFRWFCIELLGKTKKYTLLVSAFIFSIAHSLNPDVSLIGFINLILFGILLGKLYINTQSISTSIGFHFSWNVIMSTLLGFNVSGWNYPSFLNSYPLGKDIFTGSYFGLEGSIITTLFLFIFIFLIQFNIIIKMKKAD